MNEKKINILLVEDEESHADLILQSFESATVPVSLTLARNLNEAHVSIAESFPDLIVADYILPDGKGTELIPANKEEPPYPIVIMTSHGDEKVAVESIKAGAFDYIVKSASALDDMPNICEKILLEWNYTIRHKRVENELKESEARFQSILSSLYESAVVVYDRDGKITALWGTPEMDKRYGIRAVDCIGRSIRDLVPPEQAEQRFAEICRVFNAGEKMLVEYKVVLPGGSFWHETSLSPMMDANGDITAVVGFVRDITERRRVDEALRFTQFAFDNNADAIFWVKSDASISYANKMACQSLEYSYEELICMRVPDIDPGFPDESWPAHWQEMKEAGTSVFEAHHKTKAGLVFPVEIQSTYLEYKGEEYICAFARNITERKLAEERIRKLSHAVEQSSSTIIITDTKGNIEYANPKFTQLTGYTHEETIGKNPRILKSGKTPPETFKELWKTIRSGNEWRGEFCNMKKNGELYWESASISPVKNDKGIITNFIAIKDDITERKKMEETLLQSEKLKALGTITAGVGHEFNNILAVIMGSAEVLDGGFKDDQTLKRGLKTIIKAGEDGAGIVKRMLTFAKAELNVTDYIFVDIQYLIKQAIDFTKPRWKNIAQSEGITYQINTVDIIETPEVFCNPTELREVFVNLINNSMDAMPDGGTITVATRCVRQAGNLKGDSVEITFADTGKGMPEDVKKKIFDPFFTTRRPQGTGLGMSVSYGIMKRHGGRIDVESEVGKGTIFNLNIPIRKEAVQRAVPSEPIREIMTKKLRVMVVDDNEEICTLLDEFLSGSGHIVKAVNSGAEAIELSRKENFDLVICDLAMPEVTGYDVIKALNELDKSPKIGIATGWGEKLKPIEDETLKVDFVIKKPFTLSELERKINDLRI